MLSAGRELDVIIAKKIFKVDVEHVNQQNGWRIDYRANDNVANDPILAMDMVDGYRLKRYSTDLKAAWEVVEKLGQKGTQWRFSNKAFSNKYWWAYTEDAVAQGNTLQEAICLAALKHVEEQANG